MNNLKRKIWKSIKRKESLLKIFSKIYNFLYKNNKKIYGANNKIVNNGAFLSNTKIYINGNNNRIIIGKETRLNGTYIHITGDNNLIKINDKVIIGKCDLWREDSCGNICIGRKTTINSGHIACTENYGEIRIGEDCMFADNVIFRNGDSHSIIDLYTNNRLNYAKNIYIGNKVWIGEGSIILKGVEIKDDSIVATNSIVTKKFDSNCIIAGNPAIIKKTGIKWIRERI
ncbi:acyltransferase [Clostridium perfringens]|uniref:acyltransferase n=1 Tax=Clostridium perfringens TaxID=1502 RepID=UPI00244A4361|nr:acyltransferase [Clostridium perfringens]MDH2340209.1 acyltransferase [Clostridium perfringens]HDI3014533.1 acyltransferase [Clostridium perfringens]